MLNRLSIKIKVACLAIFPLIVLIAIEAREITHSLKNMQKIQLHVYLILIHQLHHQQHLILHHILHIHNFLYHLILKIKKNYGVLMVIVYMIMKLIIEEEEEDYNKMKIYYQYQQQIHHHYLHVIQEIVFNVMFQKHQI